MAAVTLRFHKQRRSGIATETVPPNAVPGRRLPGLVRDVLASPKRLVRFAVTGGSCGGIQLTLLYLLELFGLNPMVANTAAYLVSAQVNFLLSDRFVWGDRRQGSAAVSHVPRSGTCARRPCQRSGASVASGKRCRRLPGPGDRFALPALVHRWVGFHASIAGTGLLNMAVFAAAQPLMPSLMAAAAGIGAGALANFIIQDRLVFAGSEAGQRAGVLAAALADPPSLPAVQHERAGQRDGRAAPARPGEPLWARLGLLGIALLAAVLYAWNVTRNGMANEYYAATVYSMTLSPHNFFFNALDPGAFITPDKPPFAFWAQAVSARVFGFSSGSILAPQAVAGVATVLVVHHLVKRVWGALAGLIAALAVTLTPVTVAVNRDNLPDGILVLLMVLGAWGVLNAIRSARLRPLLVGAVMVGLAFNTKMLQAYIMMPAAIAVYLFAGPLSWRRRVAYLAAAGAVLAVVSASWMVIVDAVPPDQRPYIGGSSDNTVWNLVIGYNGLGRIFGEGRGTGGVPGLSGLLRLFQGGAPAPDGGFGGGGMFGGAPGWLRLFNNQGATQISWLLLGSVIGLAAGVAARLGAPRTDERRANLLFWGGWLGTHFVVFSLASGIFHPYYTTAMAPAIGALMGAGLATLWGWYRRGGIKALGLPLMIAASTGWSYVILSHVTWGQPWLTGGLLALTGLASAALAAGRLPGLAKGGLVPAGALALGLASLLWGPAAWSLATVSAATMAVTPNAGPADANLVAWPFGRSQAGFGSGPGGFDGRFQQPPDGNSLPFGGAQPGAAQPEDSPRTDRGSAGGRQNGGEYSRGDGAPRMSAGQPLPGGPEPQFGGLGGPRGGVSSQLVEYLLANQGDAKFLVAVNSANAAAPIILATGKPVIAMGGFSGSDPAPTTAQLADLVRSGQLRFVLAGGNGGPGRDGSERTAWVTAHCKAVDSAAYGGGGTLYDCSGAA